MYYVHTNTEPLSGKSVEQVTLIIGPNSAVSFPNVESNTGPERAAYLEWLAEGNTPEPWPPAE